jgi:hypothetical protein
MDHHLMHLDEPDADADDLAPTDAIEFEESDDFDSAVELDLLVGRVQAARFWA